jgi:hypothetical protein
VDEQNDTVTISNGQEDFVFEANGDLSIPGSLTFGSQDVVFNLVEVDGLNGADISSAIEGQVLTTDDSGNFVFKQRGSARYVNGQRLDIVGEDRNDMPTATGSLRTAYWTDSFDTFDTAKDVGPSSGSFGNLSAPASIGTIDIAPSETFLINSIQWVKNSNFDDDDTEGNTLLVLNDNNELIKYHVERRYDVTSNPVEDERHDLSTSVAPSGATATSILVVPPSRDFSNLLDDNVIFISYDNGEVQLCDLDSNHLTPLTVDSTLSTQGGSPVSIDQYQFFGTPYFLVLDGGSDALEEYSFDGDLSNSTFNGQSSSLPSDYTSFTLYGTSNIWSGVSNGDLEANTYKPALAGGPEIIQQGLMPNGPFASSFASIGALDVGSRPRTDSTVTVVSQTDTTLEQIDLLQGGWQDLNDYATEFAP